MPKNSDDYEQHIKRFIHAFCAECGDTVSCAPGELSDDGEYEFRKCEDEHTVKTEARYYCSPSEATEFNIV